MVLPCNRDSCKVGPRSWSGMMLIDSYVLIDFDFEDRERVDREEVVDLLLRCFLIVRFFFALLLLAFTILIGLVVLV